MKKINTSQYSLPKIGEDINLSKSSEDIFWVFSLNKSPIIEKLHLNTLVKDSVSEHNKISGGGLWKKIETSKSIEELKNTAVGYIIDYCRELWISLPEDLEKNIHISLCEWWDWLCWWNSSRIEISINNAVFIRLSKEIQLQLIIHEILHIVANKQHKLYYSYTQDKEKEEIQVNHSSSWSQTWYFNVFIWWHRHIKLWEWLNEGFTEMISRAILNKHWIDTSLVNQEMPFNMAYVYLIDWLIVELLKKIDFDYEKILTYLIRWNIMWNPKFLHIISDTLWKDFLNDLLKLWDSEELKIREFMEKYTSIYTSKTLSEHIKKVIWDISFERL